MNNKIKLAVAGAVLSVASVANAGIIIPAGDWTVDINGNVNMFAQYTKAEDNTTVAGGLASTQDARGEDTYFTTGTGLLPAWLGFTATTRQNDLDVSWTISFQPNTSANDVAPLLGMGDQATPLNRQAFLTFGDASWGSVKVGKDLGVFASDAILSDMTLLGVGAGMAGGATTLGGIGTGYLYPGWRGQIAYSTPNMNGTQATVAITNPNQGNAGAAFAQDRFGIEAKVVHTFSSGKIWVSGSSYDVTMSATENYDATALDIGMNLNYGNLGLVAYYYSGEGNGVGNSLNRLGGLAAENDQDGGYVQATYVIPSGTKLGVAVASNRQDLANGNTAGMDSNDRWTVGAYHPLTKHLNLVAEYNNIESDDHSGNNAESDSVSLGAILFF